ncbi:hypothetical protein [Sinomicrobium oceani]|uniref:hypothetical protein n=1 Tax=Sinomicrobium oceani TaxID=1150368 RepID=UPI00227A30FF|nr:hypothetical protein [Sinomicrobium oceani]
MSSKPLPENIRSSYRPWYTRLYVKKIVVGVHNTITMNFELREGILGLDQVMGSASGNRLNAGDLLRFLYRPFPRCHP